MRVSGRGGMDAVLFMAPALIFVAILMYLQGGPQEVLKVVDRLVLQVANTVSGWLGYVRS